MNVFQNIEFFNVEHTVRAHNLDQKMTVVDSEDQREEYYSNETWR